MTAMPDRLVPHDVENLPRVSANDVVRQFEDQAYTYRLLLETGNLTSKERGNIRLRLALILETQRLLDIAIRRGR